VAVADVSVQFCQIWSDVIRCDPMWSDAVISHTENQQFAFVVMRDVWCGKLEL